MATPGTKIIAGQYVLAWGGIQSAGQFIGQVVRAPVLRDSNQSFADDCLPQLLQYVTEGYGRKPALGVIWLTLILVSRRTCSIVCNYVFLLMLTPCVWTRVSLSKLSPAAGITS
jgi:hypothetical protein